MSQRLGLFPPLSAQFILWLAAVPGIGGSCASCSGGTVLDILSKNFLASPARLFLSVSQYLYIFGDFGQSEPTNLGIGVDVTLRCIPSARAQNKRSRQDQKLLE